MAIINLIRFGSITDAKRDFKIDDSKTLQEVVNEHGFSGEVQLDSASVKVSEYKLTLKELGATNGSTLVYARKNGGN